MLPLYNGNPLSRVSWKDQSDKTDRHNDHDDSWSI